MIRRVSPISKGLRHVLLICDIQERFRGIIHQYPAVIDNSKFLYDATRVLVFERASNGFTAHFIILEHSMYCH